MPRNGSSIYSQPFPNVAEGTTIESTVYNGFTHDIEADLNAPRPIVAGGTGATNATDARVALSAEAAGQIVTNYDSHVWQLGSFISSPGATSGPLGTEGYFSGICHMVSSDYIYLEAQQAGVPYPTGPIYRRSKNVTWGAWTTDTAVNDARYVNVTGDTMTGGLTLASDLRVSASLGGFPDKGTIHFGTLANKYLHYDGAATYSLAGGGLNVGGALNASGAIAGPSLNVAGGVTGASVASTGTLTVGTYIQSSGTNLILGATSGIIYFRPHGAGNGTNEATLNTDGNLSINGVYANYLTSTGNVNAVGTFTGGAVNVTGNISGASGGVSGTFTANIHHANAFDIAGRRFADGDASYTYIHNPGGGWALRTRYDGGENHHAAGSHYFTNAANSVAYATLDGSNFTIHGSIGINAGGSSLYVMGLRGKNGTSGGPTINHFNFDHESPYTHIWIDTTRFDLYVTCDYRMKKDIANIPPMWETIKKLRPVQYAHKEWKRGDTVLSVNSNNLHWGFVAHELQEALLPTAASGVKDDPVAVQCPNPMTIIAALTSALQEAMERIEALEAR